MYTTLALCHVCLQRCTAIVWEGECSCVSPALWLSCLTAAGEEASCSCTRTAGRLATWSSDVSLRVPQMWAFVTIIPSWEATTPDAQTLPGAVMATTDREIRSSMPDRLGCPFSSLALVPLAVRPWRESPCTCSPSGLCDCGCDDGCCESDLGCWLLAVLGVAGAVRGALLCCCQCRQAVNTAAAGKTTGSCDAHIALSAKPGPHKCSAWCIQKQCRL